MKAGYTKIIFVVDRSGSMSNIARDMEGGLRSLISEQRKNPGQCDVSIYEFDDKYDVVLENKDIQSDISYKLLPRGSTALYDALGKTINSVGENLAKMKEEDRPDRILFVIITDGGENSSKEFRVDQIKQLITQQTNVYNWTFTYIGANQDAWGVGGSIGISKGQVLNYVANTEGTRSAWSSLNNIASGFRCASDANLARSFVSYSQDDIKAQEEAAKVDNKQKSSVSSSNFWK